MKKGFSLIELLTVLAITTVLACIAYPSYNNYITRAHRLDGQSALLNTAYKMEHYYGEHHTYQQISLNQTQSPQGWYNLSITWADDTSFILQATPINSDTLCQTLTFNHLGVKGITAGSYGVAPKGLVSDCW